MFYLSLGMNAIPYSRYDDFLFIQDVHETAAGALWNLAFYSGNALCIVEEGGVPILVRRTIIIRVKNGTFHVCASPCLYVRWKVCCFSNRLFYLFAFELWCISFNFDLYKDFKLYQQANSTQLF